MKEVLHSFTTDTPKSICTQHYYQKKSYTTLLVFQCNRFNVMLRFPAAIRCNITPARAAHSNFAT